MIKHGYIFVLFVIVSILFGSCKKPVKYSDVPEIKFISFIARDTIDALDNPSKFGRLTFSFIDGDGDIGLQETDTAPPMNTNLRISMFNKTDSGYHEVIFPKPMDYRIKYIPGVDGQNKTLKGDIWVDMDCRYYTTYKTVKYKFFIIDRALHYSNTDSTWEVNFVQ